MRQFTVFTASTEHESKTINTINYTYFYRIIEFNKYYPASSISLDLETFANLNGLVMEESVYSGCDTNF